MLVFTPGRYSRWTGAFFGNPEAIILQAIDAELEEKNLVAEAIDGKDAVFLAPLYQSEVGCARHLKRLLDGNTP